MGFLLAGWLKGSRLFPEILLEGAISLEEAFGNLAGPAFRRICFFGNIEQPLGNR